MKAILPEISSQLTNLQYDVNGHQKTIMDYLSSNFRQINDNVVTVKNYVARTTTVSDMQFFKYFSRFERGSNSPEPLSDKNNNTSDQAVNVDSSETSNLENMTNELPQQDSKDVNKNKEHENVCILSLKLK